MDGWMNAIKDRNRRKEGKKEERKERKKKRCQYISILMGPGYTKHLKYSGRSK